jgi:hypothetical protein
VVETDHPVEVETASAAPVARSVPATVTDGMKGIASGVGGFFKRAASVVSEAPPPSDSQDSLDPDRPRVRP